MIELVKQSHSHNQQGFLCLKVSPYNRTRYFINGKPAYTYTHPVFLYDSAGQAVEPENSKKIEVAFCFDDKKGLLSEKSWSFYKKPLKDLQDNIIQVHEEHQKEGWDGYGAKPVQNLPQALKFAQDLFLESQLLVEKVDIIPENDGAICFEWFLSNERYISISVTKSMLIYNYQIGEDKGCGETNFAGKKMLFEKIQQLG